jgi:hypothetical protein
VAYVCAGGVPIAVPDVWIQYVFLNLKMLCHMIISSALMRASMLIFSFRQMSGLSIRKNLLMTESAWVVYMLVYIEIASIVNKVTISETLFKEQLSWTSLRG